MSRCANDRISTTQGTCISECCILKTFSKKYRDNPIGTLPKKSIAEGIKLPPVGEEEGGKESGPVPGGARKIKWRKNSSTKRLQGQNAPRERGSARKFILFWKFLGKERDDGYFFPAEDEGRKMNIRSRTWRMEKARHISSTWNGSYKPGQTFHSSGGEPASTARMGVPQAKCVQIGDSPKSSVSGSGKGPPGSESSHCGKEAEGCKER